MDKKRLYIIVGMVIGFVAIVIIAAAVAGLQQSQTKQSDQTQAEYVGHLGCLPHKNAKPNEPQTLECAVGLIGNDGKNYGLQDMPQDLGFEFQDEIVVTGHISAPKADERYEIVGTIKVTRADINQ